MEFEDLIEKVDLFLTEGKLSARLERIDQFFEEKIRIGLDIGARTLKMVQIQETTAGPELLSWGIRDIPMTGPERDSEVIQVLRDLWQEKKIRNRRARVVISDSNVYLRHISIPVVPEEDLVKAVKWQAEKYVPFSIENAVVDFQILKSHVRDGQRQMEILIVAAENSLIERYVNIIKEARLMPTTLDVTPFAASRALIHNYQFDNDEIVPLVDIGEQVTSIVVVKNDELQMVRSVGFGTSFLLEQFSKEMAVSQQKAKELIQDIALTKSPQGSATDMRQLAAWEGFRSEIVGQLNRSLAYCEQEFMDKKIQRIYLCGGGARINSIDSCLSEDLGLGVAVADPLTKIRTSLAGSDPAGDLVRASPQLMAVIGEVL